MLGDAPAMAAEQAREILKVIPRQPDALMLLAQACQRAGDPEGALSAAHRLVALAPNHAPAWRMIAELHRAAGDDAAAQAATARELAAAATDPRLIEAG
ncbi:MAG: tetratricopeptide repeat protein, partial [Alphaproteobacteria bacterium]